MSAKKPKVAQVVEVVETEPIEDFEHEFEEADVPPDDPDDEDEGDGDDEEPDAFESLEACLDETKVVINSLRGEVLALKEATNVNTQAQVSLTACLNELNNKLGGLTGLGKIGKLFG